MENQNNELNTVPAAEPQIDPKASHMVMIAGYDWKPCRWEDLEYTLELAANAAEPGQRVSYRKL